MCDPAWNPEPAPHDPLEACPLMFSRAPRTTAAVALGLVCCPVARGGCCPPPNQFKIRWMVTTRLPEVSLEADFGLVDDAAGTSSAFDLSTVALGMELRAGNRASGRLVVDYDGGTDEIGPDEANITLGAARRSRSFSPPVGCTHPSATSAPTGSRTRSPGPGRDQRGGRGRGLVGPWPDPGPVCLRRSGPHQRQSGGLRLRRLA